MQQIGVRQLADWLADDSRRRPVLLDVRETWEFALGGLPGSQHIPMHLIPQRLAELNRDDEIVAICHHGGRSMQVAMFLERQGFSTLFNLSGGILRLVKFKLWAKLKAGDVKGAANEFLDISKAGGVEVKGLTLRRRAEARLFLS